MGWSRVWWEHQQLGVKSHHWGALMITTRWNVDFVGIKGWKTSWTHETIRGCNKFGAFFGWLVVAIWGEVVDQLKQVQQIQATASGAFAAIRSDRTVVTWGNQEAGGDSRAVQEKLQNVQQIQATLRAFAAICDDGRIVSWGDPDFGGDASKVQCRLHNVESVVATTSAFAAILMDGSIVVWGDPANGGDDQKVQDLLRELWWSVKGIRRLPKLHVIAMCSMGNLPGKLALVLLMNLPGYQEPSKSMQKYCINEATRSLPTSPKSVSILIKCNSVTAYIQNIMYNDIWKKNFAMTVHFLGGAWDF